MPRPRPLTHASRLLSISLQEIAVAIGTFTVRRPTLKCQSPRGARPVCLTQECARRSCWRTRSPAALQVFRARADYAAYLADRNGDERGVCQVSDPDGDIDSFLDQIHDSIHEQQIRVDVWIAAQEIAHDRRDVAPAE